MYTQPASSVAEPIVVNLSPPEVKVAAGGQPVEIIAEVRNAGQTVDQYSIEIENLDPSWYTITVQSVSLFPDSAPIPIRIHPPKSKDTRAGHHAFVVKARSHADPMLMGKTKGVVQVGSYAVFHMELAPSRFTGRKGKYRLKMANGGNSELQLELEPHDPESNLNYGIKKSDPTIDPGATLVMPITVKPKGFHLVGEGQRYKFSIVGRPVDGAPEDAKEVQGELAHKLMFASWKIPIMVLVTLALLLLFLSFRSSIVCNSNANSAISGARQFFVIPWVIEPLYDLVCAGVDKVNSDTVRAPTGGHKFDESTFHSGDGYKEVRDNYGDAIGQAEENEWYDANGISHQKTAKGQLMYFVEHEKNNKDGIPRIYFISKDGKAYTFVECNPPLQFKGCKMVELNSQNQ